MVWRVLSLRTTPKIGGALYGTGFAYGQGLQVHELIRFAMAAALQVFV